MSSKLEEFPDVNVMVTHEDSNVVVKFDKNIGLLKIGPEMALKMADMIKLEAVKVLRSGK